MDVTGLPTGSVLVRAVVISVGLGAAGVSMADPIPEIGMQTGVTQGDEGIVVAVPTGTSNQATRAAAAKAVIEALRVHPSGMLAHAVPQPDEVDDYAKRLAKDDGFALKEVDQAGDVTRFHLPSSWWEEHVAQLQVQRTIGSVWVVQGLLGEIRVVNANPPLTVLLGDVLLEVEGSKLTSWEDVGALPTSWKGVPQGTLKRNGTVGLLVEPVHGPLDKIELAPTCGPCCHGDCDREILGPGDVPVLE